jgi:hypothetical protein
VSAVLQIAPELRVKIAQAIHERALKYPTSVCADVKPERFDAVVEAVCRLIDLESGFDFDTALWGALGRHKHNNKQDFIYRPQHPNRNRNWNPLT